MNTRFVGRTVELELLRKALVSERSEMIVVIGRRRVGKTHLIKQAFGDRLDFEMTGIQHANLSLQLANFFNKLQEFFKLEKAVAPPVTWFEAFSLLKAQLPPKRRGRKKVIFLDELPWICTPKSGFFEALGHFWNDWAVNNHVLIALCGSAASWMINQVQHHKGSLHNRISQLIHLQPFTLAETALFLNEKKVVLNQYQIVQLYMVTGGVPHYLNDIDKSRSVAQNVDRLCFSPHGLLKDEFAKLYSSLFDAADSHIAVIRALAGKWVGLTRSELLNITGFTDGGSFTRILTELEQSDFITTVLPFNKKKKEMLYRLIDNYSLFYLKFMEDKRKGGEGTFLSLERTSSWKSWCGYAFENICLTHLPQIKSELGISGVYTDVSSYFQKGTAKEKGVQIDMLINRADGIINLCEIKFYDAPFVITKDYAIDLRQKRDAVRKAGSNKKSIFITLITCFGVHPNSYASELVQSHVSIEKLFA